MENIAVRIIHFFGRKSFKFFEKYFRLHITPVHYYSPIPTTYELDSNVFKKVYDCTGVDWKINQDAREHYLFLF